MTTQNNRPQNRAETALPDDIEKMLERQLKQEKSRQEYNRRPDVKAKRKKYQAEQQRMRNIARAALKGGEEGKAKLIELGYSEADADKLIATAQKIKS